MGYAARRLTHPTKEKTGKRNADKRCATTSAPRDLILPRARGAEGRGTAPEGAARLSAFHHGTCGSDRTPPLSFSHATSGDLVGAHAPMVRKTRASQRRGPDSPDPHVTAGVTRAFLSPSSEFAPADRS